MRHGCSRLMLCVRDRGEPGADRVSPAWKEAPEGRGPLGPEPWEAPWLLPGGGDTWAGTRGPLPWPHLRCHHMDTGIGPGVERGGEALGGHLSDKALQTSLSPAQVLHQARRVESRLRGVAGPRAWV